MRFLTPSEILTLADAMPARYRVMIVFDSYCGLRMGELAASVAVASTCSAARSG